MQKLKNAHRWLYKSAKHRSNDKLKEDERQRDKRKIEAIETT
jgi:hypothetical protein